MKAHWVNNGTSTAGFGWQGGETVNPQTDTRVEAVLGEPNFKSIWWLELALDAARSVGRVKLPNGSASGFLIAPDIFMTNNHVFEDEGDARNATLQFNYRLLANEDPAPRDDWTCDPDDLFKTNEDLDYSIVRVKEKDAKKAGDVWGHFNLRHGTNVVSNQRVNIIQHPQGRFQEIAFRDNQVKNVSDNFIQYLTDTDYGTSGSPVFDDFFNVVALHNQRVPDPSNPTRWYRNQGFRVEAILADADTLIP
ncbi:MAG: serine protease [Gammaproteobacteria bacterium]|nr:serine protease [Gammaproteobacteria bacterium]